MAESVGANRDVVLAPGEQLYMLDETKGYVQAYVGPHKMSRSDNDKPVVFDPRTRRFTRVEDPRSAIVAFPFAAEGDYIVLFNPAKSETDSHPKQGGSSTSVVLNEGQRLVIPGPATFPLWPGQTADVIPGHHLRLNQYLLVRVYNEEAARDNWDKGIMKPQTQSSEDEDSTNAIDPSTLVQGQVLVIKGTDYSFYIPPTGVEVLMDKSTSSFVRDAVTLEQLEYCILLDDNGKKRYVQGPDVVFPKPTETFVQKDSHRKFRAVELSKLSGIYIKVVSPYEENGIKHEIGEEIFLTGKNNPMYFPRPEHSIITYDDSAVHYAIAIPSGEGRYIMSRDTGEIPTIHGPKMHLPDPRTEVIVRRVLPERYVKLMYPGNTEALTYNKNLETLRDSAAVNFVPDNKYRSARSLSPNPALFSVAASAAAASFDYGQETDAVRENAGKFTADTTQRGTTYTAPRAVTLDNKFDGAVTMSLWNGYAALLVKRTGQRRVIQGPQTAILDYDELPLVLNLSTGKPKNTDVLYPTVYLQVKNNKVSDIISAETADMVKVDVKVSYRVDFIGEDPEKWFEVDNYVKFMCDHMRSRIRNVVQKIGIEAFHETHIDVIRDTVLGVSKNDVPRRGFLFTENNLHIYDVEVLGLVIGDTTISKLLIDAQHETVSQTLGIRRDEQKLALTKRSEQLKRELLTEQTVSRIHQAETSTQAELEEAAFEEKRIAKGLEVSLKRVKAEGSTQLARLTSKKAEQEQLAAIEAVDLARAKAKETQDLTISTEKQKLRIELLDAETEATVALATAVNGVLAEAIITLGDKKLAGELTEHLAPLAILGGTSVVDVAGKLLEHTPIGDAIGGLVKKSTGVRE